MRLICALSLSNPVQLPVSLFILKQYRTVLLSHGLVVLLTQAICPAFIFLYASLFTSMLLLFNLCSFHFCPCVWLWWFCVTLSDYKTVSLSDHKRNLRQSFAAACPAYAHSEEAEALDKKMSLEQEQKFWATVLKPNKFLLAAPYQVHLGKLLTPTSHRALVIAMLMTQCTVRFSQKIKFIIHSFLLDKGKREAPEWHWIYTSWLKHMI